jgi:hypothetical protein
MKITRLIPSQSQHGGWLITGSNQTEMWKLMTSLADGDWRIAHRRSHSYWVTDQALIRMKGAFTNWREFSALQAQHTTPQSRRPQTPAVPPHQQYQLTLSPASQHLMPPARVSQSAVGGFARQAQVFDVCLVLQQNADHVTMQLARHLPVREYADIIAALQVLFRQVDGISVTNPSDLNEEVQELLRVLLRPIARIGVDPGTVMAEYQRARIAALDGEDRVPEY